jgi:hypothetical protein
MRHSVKAEGASLVHQTLTDYASESNTTADYYRLAARLDEAAARKAAQR